MTGYRFTRPVPIRNVSGMLGLGDGLFIRGFIRHFPGVFLSTPWPELYHDLDVKCVRPATSLRTQNKNIRSTAYKWHTAPMGPQVQVGYRQGTNIIQSMQAIFRVRPVFDLPDFGPSPIQSHKPVAIIRPVTERREWLNQSRNPLPEYVCQAAEILRDSGYHVVSIADIRKDHEWIVGKAPYADEQYHAGQLSVTQLLAAVQSAAMVVGGVGWIVPAAISAGVPLFVINGGQGASNSIEMITDKRYMDLSKVGVARPDPMCMCKDNLHQCEKTIHGFADKFADWLGRPRMVA